MRQAFVFDSLEARSHLSATALAASKVHTIGQTAGVTAQVVTPVFTDAVGSVNGAEDSNTGIDLDSALKVHVNVNGTGTIDNTKLTRASVKITNLDTGAVQTNSTFLSKVITSGGGDVIIVSFKKLLPEKTNFSIELNYAMVPAASKIRTTNGSGSTYFADKTFNFSTGTHYAKSSLTSGFISAATTAGDHAYTCVTMGPDGKLYASDTQGYIYAYTINDNGSLDSTPTVINTIRNQFGGNRLITGITFKPASTATNMEMWVSSSQYRFGNNPSGTEDVQKSADNFTGEIDAISGTGLTAIQPLVIHIPRSVKDHTNNQITFSPNGKSAFFGVAAMNAMGAADSTWGYRVENIYSATIMSLKVGGDNGIYGFMRRNGGPVDLMIDGQQDSATGLVAGTTHYNIYKGSNPLRIFADGIRNDYDMVYADDGHLYAGINGSSAGGNVPATPSDLSTVPVVNRPDKDAKNSKGKYIYHSGGKSTGALITYAGPTSPGLTNVATVEEDTLLDVQNGAYYGHPNAARGEYILDGGNPTSKVDDFEIAGGSGYAIGQQPDRNYTTPVYDFGQDYSPDGMFQYQTVGGKNKDLDGYILVCRYSSGGDILALQPKDGAIGLTQARIPGFTDLGTPLDVTEDMSTGNLYVAILSDETGHGSIQLLKPTTTASVKAKALAAGSDSRTAAVASPVAVKSAAASPVAASPVAVVASSKAAVFSSKSLVKDLDLVA